LRVPIVRPISGAKSDPRLAGAGSERTAMQTSNRFFDDFAKVASGAASTLVGVKQELDALIRQRLERLIADLDLVSREDFEAVRATATHARAAQEELEQRVTALEARLQAVAQPHLQPTDGAEPQAGPQPGAGDPETPPSAA
jgi:BMFP domain-containing protein YqiC